MIDYRIFGIMPLNDDTGMLEMKVAIKYAIRTSEARFEKELRFTKRLGGVDVAWHFDPARQRGGDLCDFLSPEPNTLAAPFSSSAAMPSSQTTARSWW